MPHAGVSAQAAASDARQEWKGKKKFEREVVSRRVRQFGDQGQKRCVRSLSQPYSAQISRQMGLQASSCGCRAPVSVDDGGADPH